MDMLTKGSAYKSRYTIMSLIIDEQQCQKFARIVKEKGIRIGTIVLGKGTVKSATLNLLGIKSQKKEIISILLEKEKSNEVLDYFTKELLLHKPGHGIAYTSPVITASQIINDDRDNLNKLQDTEVESMYKKLTVVVNRGMAEDVMNIARKSGVNGGTIIHGRGTGTDFTAKSFGIEIEPEKELVMMLMPSSLIDKVVNALYQELHLENPGNGVLFVEPILEVRGLFDSSRDTKGAK